MDPKTSGARIETLPGTGVPAFSELNGMEVRDRSGDKIGTVRDVYTDREGAQTLRYLSISTGWLGTRRHVVPLDDIEWSSSDEFLILPYGRGQLESAPTYDERHELSTDDEESIYGYYGLPGYWDVVRAKQTTPAPTPQIAEADVAEALARGEDPLRTDYPVDDPPASFQTQDPGRRTMGGKGADQFGDLDPDARYDQPRSRVRRFDW